VPIGTNRGPNASAFSERQKPSMIATLS